MPPALRPSRPAVAVAVAPERELWTSLLAHLRSTQADICRQWFEDIEPLGIDGGQLKLRAHSGVHRDYLNRACVKAFNDAAQAVSGRLISVRFVGPDEPGAEPARPAAPVITVVHQPAPSRSVEPEAILNAPIEPDIMVPPMSAPAPLSPQDIEHLYDDGLTLNPDYGFEHFVVGPGNRLAHVAALAVAANPGRAYNPFFVHGDVGLGKTHLLQAICLAIRANNPRVVIYYTSCEGFMTQFFDAVQAGRMNHFRHKFRHVDVLLIDDVHFLAKRDRTQEEFFHTFNSLYQNHKQIVLSSDAPPEDIPDLEERLVSRFKWGLVTNLDPPCYETRVEILKQKAKIRGLELPDDVACYVASKIDSNIRELEGAVTKLQVLSSVEKRPIDMGIARLALQDTEIKVEPKIQIQTIINAVTDFFGVKVTDLQSKRRQRSIAQPRQLCMYLARRHTRYSLEEIGGYFGGRDHTTVMHAVKTIDDRCEKDGEFKDIVRSLEDKLRAPVA